MFVGLANTPFFKYIYSEHRQFRVIDSSGTPLEKHISFFQNDKVFRYFNYPVIFPNLLAASNLLVAVES